MTTDSLLLTCPDSLPENAYREFANELKARGVPFQIERKPSGIYAGLEWALPSVICAYLCKPFLETILKNAADDAYPAIKDGFKKLFRSLFGAKASERRLCISSLVSIYFAVQNGHMVKALIWEGISEDMQEEAIEKLFELIKGHYESSAELQNHTLIDPPEGHVRWGTLYLRFNIDIREWESIDIIVEARKRQSN